jgi:hypothetical protein
MAGTFVTMTKRGPDKTCAQEGYTREGIMDFGVQLATSSHSWKVVKHAEELGFTP